MKEAQNRKGNEENKLWRPPLFADIWRIVCDYLPSMPYLRTFYMSPSEARFFYHYEPRYLALKKEEKDNLAQIQWEREFKEAEHEEAQMIQQTQFTSGYVSGLNTDLFTLCKEGDLESIRAACSVGYAWPLSVFRTSIRTSNFLNEFFQIDPEGNTPLYYAHRNGHHAILAFVYGLLEGPYYFTFRAGPSEIHCHQPPNRIKSSINNKILFIHAVCAKNDEAIMYFLDHRWFTSGLRVDNDITDCHRPASGYDHDDHNGPVAACDFIHRYIFSVISPNEKSLPESIDLYSFFSYFLILGHSSYIKICLKEGIEDFKQVDELDRDKLILDYFSIAYWKGDLQLIELLENAFSIFGVLELIRVGGITAEANCQRWLYLLVQGPGKEKERVEILKIFLKKYPWVRVNSSSEEFSRTPIAYAAARKNREMLFELLSVFGEDFLFTIDFEPSYLRRFFDQGKTSQLDVTTINDPVILYMLYAARAKMPAHPDLKDNPRLNECIEKMALYANDYLAWRENSDKQVTATPPALYSAVKQKGSYNKVKRLLEETKPNVNEMNSDNGATALHAAAYSGDEAVVKCLIASKANVDMLATGKNNQGNTPLFTAVLAQRQPHIIKQLLDAKADVTKPNANGDNPFSLAIQQGDKETIELLCRERLTAFIESTRSKLDEVNVAITKLTAEAQEKKASTFNPIWDKLRQHRTEKTQLENALATADKFLLVLDHKASLKPQAAYRALETNPLLQEIYEACATVNALSCSVIVK